MNGDEVRDLGRLRRSRTDRKVAGVAGGLARHLDVDPLILRIAFVVLALFGGAGIILYGACWLFVPEDGDEKAPFHLDERSRTVALLIAGAIAAVALVGDSWGAFWFPWPVAIVALVVLWLVTRSNDRPSAPPPGAPSGSTSGPTPTTPTTPTTPAYLPPAHTPYQHVPPPGDQTGYRPGYHAGYQPPPPAYYPPHPVAVRPPNPRKRGPILFWFTLALVALAVGVLGIVDVAGGTVAASAYPALALGICGLMLVVGAFFGRAGGLIALGCNIFNIGVLPWGW